METVRIGAVGVAGGSGAGPDATAEGSEGRATFRAEMEQTRKGNGAGAIPRVAATAHPPGDKPDRGRERDNADRGREVDTAVHPAIQGDWRLAELEAGLGERDAQLAEAERTIAEAAGELGRRARRKVLEGREALAEAHARLEREVEHVMVLEAEIDRQISMREAAGAEAEQRLGHLEAQSQRDIAEAKAASERKAASAQAALERSRTAAAADMDRARAGFEEKLRQLEIALRDAKASVDEARGRLDEERASRQGLDERLAAAADAEAAAAREAAGLRRELELSQSELERLRGEHARLRSELAAAEARSREPSGPGALQAKPGIGSRAVEQHADGGAEAAAYEPAPTAQARPRRFGRSRRRAAELQTQLGEARGEARAEGERAARLKEELERATAAERQLRADLERTGNQSSGERSLMGSGAGGSRGPGGTADRTEAGIARAGLLDRIRARAKR